MKPQPLIAQGLRFCPCGFGDFVIIFKHCKKSYQIMISHILTNMILTNYLRGPGIIPAPQVCPSNQPLKLTPQKLAF